MIAFLLSLLLACTGAAPADTDVGGVRFPHADGYDVGALHGTEAISAGAGACVSCHREGTSAPSCASCHDAYPHPEGWLAGAVHGYGIAGGSAAEARAECQTCHGAPGLQTKACGSCHPSYPHPNGWETAGQHGAWGLTHGTLDAACGSCHGARLDGTGTAPSCSSCHPAWPHRDGAGGPWAHPTQHGAADLATCVTCHGATGTGGTSGIACSRCHANFPHPTDWAQSHVAVANQVGQGACVGCHPAALAPALPASCGAACHGGAR